MTLSLLKSSDRGHFDHGWLKSYHSFSFASYYNPKWLGFRNLLVINEDFISPGTGFGTHGHEDMEIISYLVGGQLEHKDSMGNGEIIYRGDVQYMSAGTGVKHSEHNPSQKETTHLLQIWIKPSEIGKIPRYGKMNLGTLDRVTSGQWIKIAGPENSGVPIAIRAHATLSVSFLNSDQSVQLPWNAKLPFGWVQVVKGEVELRRGTSLLTLKAGDGIGIESSKEFPVSLKSVDSGKSELLWFELN